MERNLRALGGVSAEIEAGTSPEQLVARALDGFQYELLERQPLEFRCRCSRDRALRIMSGLRPGELDDMIRADEGAELVCHFCNQRYHYDTADLIGLRHELETHRREDSE
jgi:molecular chaperone Hsp33